MDAADGQLCYSPATWAVVPFHKDSQAPRPGYLCSSKTAMNCKSIQIMDVIISLRLWFSYCSVRSQYSSTFIY